MNELRRDIIEQKDFYFNVNQSEIAFNLVKYIEYDGKERYHKVDLNIELNNVVGFAASAKITAHGYVEPDELKKLGMWFIENASKIEWTEAEIKKLQDEEL